MVWDRRVWCTMRFTVYCIVSFALPDASQTFSKLEGGSVNKLVTLRLGDEFEGRIIKLGSNYFMKTSLKSEVTIHNQQLHFEKT